MQWSRLTIPTLKEKPADAEVPSHELLIRAGMIRTVAAGVFTLLPLGARVLRRVEDIVRSEMDSAGALEIVLPTMQPKELWEASGRWSEYGPEMVRLKDRQERGFCLAPTAEELVTQAVSSMAPSYRDLPVNLYQIQTKYRDEIRPRFGLLRAREFRMKDAYSFHTTRDDLDREYENMRDAYCAVAERCDLDYRIVEAATGLIGGDVSHEFMVLSTIGEDALTYCSSCDYGANVELEEYEPATGRFGGEGSGAPVEVHTPGCTTIRDVAAYIGVDTGRMLKCVLYVADEERVVAVFIPGYREANEAKIMRVVGTDVLRPLRDDERERFPQVVPGFCGPVGLEGVLTVADEEIRGAEGMVCGANREDYHLTDVKEGRDFSVDKWSSVALAVEGDTCRRCGAPLRMERGIEIGHIFKLGTKYSESLGARFIDKQGEIRPIIMGTYGIGTSRLLAAVVEKHHDDQGIAWPVSIAPADVEIITVGEVGDELTEAAERLRLELSGIGLEVLWDDREASPGVKFNDADLVGVPLQVVVGNLFLREGRFDVKVRRDGGRREVEAEDAPGEILRIREGLK